ncbi:MAG: M12 family metallo-peptidase [Planctomycetota bacterium]|nr:M12 family metallo-peptidase [Planctomycetota bacterium]
MGWVRGLLSGIASLAGVLVSSGAWAGGAVQSDDGMWSLREATAEAQRSEPWVRPLFFQGAALDVGVLEAVLADAPLEFTPEAMADPGVIQLPMPDGTFQRFEFWLSPVMEPELAARFPEIRTYAGQGIDDPTATLRFDLTPQGFHAQILSAEGSFYIDPYSRGDVGFYAVYDKLDLRERAFDDWTCVVSKPLSMNAPLEMRGARAALRSGTFLQTYRTAVATTIEYTNFHGGTQALGLAAVTTAINRVTGIYERELAIRLQLIANNNTIIFTNSTGDSYSNSNGPAMLSQNQSVLDTNIGNANYDVGHVFSTGGGGIASLGVVCRAGLKAQGVTGLPSPTGDAFYVDYVAHEMGHQFGANHSFNSGVCAANRNGATAFEPGSGSTIMSYAGICGSDDLQVRAAPQASADGYFVNISFDEILSYSTGASGGCPANTGNGNTVPLIDAGPNFTIPASTPFILTPTSFSDANGDSLTFCWEQRNIVTPAAQTNVGGVFPDVGNNPIIRSWPPSTSASRIIPRVQNLVANTFAKGEALPTTNRTLRFSCTVRDNRAGGGGVNTDTMDVAVTTSAGPFTVTAPNTAVSLSGSTTVTWNVANTNLAPVSCASVTIELSTDGGNTFPTVLLASTPNDGSEAVTLPAVATTQARIRVRALGNIFFDISNANFTIAPPAAPGAFSLTSPLNGASGVGLTPTLLWGSSATATSYAVVIDDEPSLTAPFVYQTSTGSTSAIVPAATLTNLTTYYWRVTASNASGSTVGTPTVSSFVTAPPPPPGAFVLLSPANNAVNVSDGPTLSWGASVGASSYTVVVDNEPSFTPPVAFQTVTGGTSVGLAAGTLLDGMTYYWTVTANNSGGSTFGTPNPSQFVTAPPPFCAGDADGDGDRDFGDIGAVLASFGAVYVPGSAGYGDANNDGFVDFADISAVLANWQQACP